MISWTFLLAVAATAWVLVLVAVWLLCRAADHADAHGAATLPRIHPLDRALAATPQR